VQADDRGSSPPPHPALCEPAPRDWSSQCGEALLGSERSAKPVERAAHTGRFWM